MKNWSEMIKNLTMLTQFGLSLITPLILCIGISWYLDTHTGIGGWIYIAGFFFGLGGSVFNTVIDISCSCLNVIQLFVHNLSSFSYILHAG